MRATFASSFRSVSVQDWNSLVPEAAHPFLDARFFQALEESFAVGPASGWVPFPLVVYEEDELIAAAPSYIKDNSEGEFVYDFAWADVYRQFGRAYYPKLVVASPFTPVSGARMLSRDRNVDDIHRIIAETTRAATLELGLSGVHFLFNTAHEASALERFGFFTRTGVQFQFHRGEISSFDDYLNTLSPKRRRQIRRERRDLAEQGVTFEHVRGRPSSEQVATMFRFYVSTTEKYFPWSRQYLNLEFFRLLSEALPNSFYWVFAHRNGKPIAGAMNFASGTRLFGRYWGCSEELPFLHFATCYYEGIEAAIKHGFSSFEPGAGGDHKRVRGFQPTLTFSSHWLAEPKLHRMFQDYCERERAHLTEELSDE